MEELARDVDGNLKFENLLGIIFYIRTWLNWKGGRNFFVFFFFANIDILKIVKKGMIILRIEK